MSEVIGNANEAYNIGRTELLAWLNEILQLNYTKVEQVSNGSQTHTNNTASLALSLTTRNLTLRRLFFLRVQVLHSARSWTRRSPGRCRCSA